MGAVTPEQPRHILLATDLSARCDRATNRALQLAAAWNARLSVVHAIEIAELTDDFDRKLATAKTRARWLIQNDIAANTQRDVSVFVEVGSPQEVVPRLVETLGCDLVITGISRNDWLGQTMLGSTATAVTRGAKVPVLVVKKRGGQPYRRIIAATDLSDASMPAIATGLHLFGEADLTVFHAFSAPLNRFVTDSDKYRAELHRGAYADCRAAIAQVSAAAADELAIVAEYGDPASTLAEYAQAANADLVLAGTHGRTGLLNVLLGSVAAEILVKAPCDVMVIPSRPTRPGTAT